MPFLPPNQQRQSTEGQKINKKPKSKHDKSRIVHQALLWGEASKDVNADLVLSTCWCFIIQNLQSVKILRWQNVIERDKPLAQLNIETTILQTANEYSIGSPLMNLMGTLFPFSRVLKIKQHINVTVLHVNVRSTSYNTDG